MSIRKPPKIRKSISIRWQEGFGITEIMISAGILSVMALGMASLSEMVNRNQVINRTISSRDDLKTSVDRNLKFHASLKNSANHPSVAAIPGNQTLKRCLGDPDGSLPPCVKDVPVIFTLLGQQGSAVYSGNFNAMGSTCGVPGPDCPIIVTTRFTPTCAGPSPCNPADSFLFDYRIAPAAGVRGPASIIDKTAPADQFFATRGDINSGIGGGGTPTSLARWNASGTLASSAIVFEDNTQKLGIGTSAPNTKVEISGVSADVGTNLLFVDGNAPTSGWTGDLVRFRSQSGNINLGLTTLHVEGNVSYSDNSVSNTLLFLEHSNPAAGAGAGYVLHTKTGRSGIISESVITQDGKWGIGVTNPDKMLDIGKTTPAGSMNYLLSLRGTSAAANTSVGIAFDAEGYLARTKGGLVYAANGAGWSHGDFHFLQNNTNDASEATLGHSVMTITSGGKVGIGTTVPRGRLDVTLGPGNNDLVIFNPISFAAAGGAWFTSGGLLGQSSEFQIVAGSDLSQPITFYTGGTRNTMTPGTERMRITNGGNVGIGTTAPTTKLHISGNGNLLNLQNLGASQSAYMSFLDSSGNTVGSIGHGSSPEDLVYFASTGGHAFMASPTYIGLRGISSGAGTHLCFFPSGSDNVISDCSSSRRYKEEITPLDPDLDKVLQLEAVKFKWKNRDETGVGLIAEDVADLVPELVFHKEGQVEGVRYDGLSVHLLEVVKKQNRKINDQEAQIESLRSELKELSKAIRKLAGEPPW